MTNPPVIRFKAADSNRSAHYMVDDVLVWENRIGEHTVLTCGGPYHYGATDCQHVIAIQQARKAAAAVPLCHGAEDENGHAACDGPDVRPYRAQAPGSDEWFVTTWCVECAAIAKVDGYTVEDAVATNV